MKIAVISFTRRGSRLCSFLVEKLRERGEDCAGYVQQRFFSEEIRQQKGMNLVTEGVGEWTEKQFNEMDGLIYIGAAGIAVRAIAPVLKSKLTDPAVVVMDETGGFAVSLLSGHVGGANRLAKAAAEICNAVPVITTASDVNGKAAIDVWADDHGLLVGSTHMARRLAAAALEDEPIGFFSDFPLEDEIPKGYMFNKPGKMNVWITVKQTAGEGMLRRLEDEGRVLHLIPKCVSVGIGCRRRVSGERIKAMVQKVLEGANLEERAVARLASIDLKETEEGICWLAKHWKVPFLTFSAEELERAEGTFAESSFVRQTVGAGNVCERAAMLAAGKGAILASGKQTGDGVAVAAASARYIVIENGKVL